MPWSLVPETTLPIGSDSTVGTASPRVQQPQKRFEPPIIPAISPVTGADSTPLQIWEGSVIDVDRDAGVMRVLLEAKMSPLPRHTGEIDLEWVAEQDADLVRPGAVFYLTLFKRTKRGSIENAQELRFRRRPSWSGAQLKQVERDATLILSKMKGLSVSA